MTSKSLFIAVLVTFVLLSAGNAFTPLPVENDPLVRMPGTQPDQGVVLQDPGDPNGCITCHGENPTDGDGNIVAPGFTWSGSMMAQAGRDPIFWACMAVAGQDSVWALGNPNAVDICERCHFPQGWLAGRSDPPNASLMAGSDLDGVHCDACHRMWDPFHKTTYSGEREGSDWIGYWDEAGNTGPGAVTRSYVQAGVTLLEDRDLATAIELFSGLNFFINDLPKFDTYAENGAGQYFVSTANGFVKKRASFADPAESDHTNLYSRHHKSKYFCSTCHDVSNPALANACADLKVSFPSLNCLPDQSGGANLITEQYSANRYFHVERTFSEFILSAYGRQGGAATNPEFQTAAGVSLAAKCQDCHMPDVRGKGCGETGAPIRPDQSTEHPNSGAPLHDLQGGNLWITHILASLDDDSAADDPFNYNLLLPADITNLTLDMNAGITPTDNGDALLDASARAADQLRWAATIKKALYNPVSGKLSFRIQNNTGHKLISGFPEGRRMFVNIKAYRGAALIHEVNPYDNTVGTLKGLSHPDSPALGANESYVDALVYEVHPESDLTGENETFHFVLATGRYKDNRIPPKGFDIANAVSRLIDPVDHGASAPNYFSAAEYAGGYDDVSLSGVLPKGADRVEIRLFYQGTSREYVKFLRDEINGTANTLSRSTPLKPGGDAGAYIVQTDAFFTGFRAWGDTIWKLWQHNHGFTVDSEPGVQVPGIVPFEMTGTTALEGSTDLTPSYLLLIL